ncbi:hypothetical protein ACEWF1_09860, partial [Bifidobacterium longum subsp. longum]|uniref:hypothetical protein n=1 Tax=Bifidobacterium longum TaxID=216816 RepID=UPI003D064CC9
SILRSEVVKAEFATVEQQKSEDADRTIEHKIKNIRLNLFRMSVFLPHNLLWENENKVRYN